MNFASPRVIMLKFGCFMLTLFTGSLITKGQDLRPMLYSEFRDILHQKKDRPVVVNIWATWCKPCLDEMPFFVAAAQEMKDREFIFVSVDFKSQTEKVKQKVQELGLQGTLVLITDQDGSWINELDPQWPGAIPYTFQILPDGKRLHHYDAFPDYLSLVKFLKSNHDN